MSLFDSLLPVNFRLLKAVKAGNTDMVKKLIQQKADVNMMSRRGDPALAIAYSHGFFEIAAELIRNGAEVNDRYGLAMVMNECEKGNTDLIKLLILHGADINGKNKAGTFPLLLACAENQIPAIKILIESGADVNATDNNGTSALMVCAARGIEQAVDLLIQKGADVSIRNNEGITALDSAEQKGHSHIADMLKAAGAR